MNKISEVYFLGKKIKFELAEDIDEERFKEIVRFVETKYKKIKLKINDIDSFKLGLLTSIHIAEELFNQKNEIEKMSSFFDKIDRMIS
jgi:cell division protein ZapA (FtsZ GTPase activity inhibitor)